MFRRIFLGLVMVSCISCGDADDPRWTLRFVESGVSDSVVLVRARIIDGGCDVGVVLHEVEVRGDGPPADMAPLLDAGRYGFEGEAIDDQCRIVATGCLDVDLPSSREIVVQMESGPGTAECPPGTCNDGTCDDTAVVRVAAGRAHTCATDLGGRLHCWGRNETGQVGDGTTTDRVEPAQVAEALNPGALAAGGIVTNWRSHSCVTDGGEVLCWGYNAQGQVGDGSMVDRPRPTAVSNLANVSSLSAGGRHSCAARDDGAVLCWGHDDFGQLGVGGGADVRLEPTEVMGVTNVVQVCAGQDHTCARTFAGRVTCWGANANGQLGDGGTEPRSTAGGNAGFSGRAVDIACGESHSCAVLDDGAVFCWGMNDASQVGQMGGGSVLTPARVPDIDDATNVALGGKVSCARRSTGVVSCWGTNAFGQLGRGELGGSSTTPIDVAGIDDALRIAYGADHGCVARASGQLWCWGRNQWGRLGDGTMEDRAAPVLVLGPE